MSVRKVEHQYSGDNSKLFWRKVNSLPDSEQSELYSLGVALQNLEGFVLKRLSEVKKQSVKNKQP